MDDRQLLDLPPVVRQRAALLLAAVHLDEFRDAINEVLDGAEEGTCRHCGGRILSLDSDQSWIHAWGSGDRGCRAASFVSGEGWNDSLDRKWYAAPVS